MFAAIVFHVQLDGTAYDVVVLALLVNITLFLFNLLPVPPLDGSRVVGAVMNDRMYERWLSLDRYGVAVIIAVVLIFNRQFQAILGDTSEAIVRMLQPCSARLTDGLSLSWDEVEGVPLLRWSGVAGVTAAFSGRRGGVSEGAYASLNLGLKSGDDLERVAENRRRLCAAAAVEVHARRRATSSTRPSCRWPRRIPAGRSTTRP